MITPDDLRTITIFADLDDDALGWLAEHVEEVRLAPGEALAEAGAPADWLYINLSGLLRTIVRRDNREVGTFSFESGTVGGMLPRSRMTHFASVLRAVEPSRVGRLHKRHFPEMLRRIPVLDDRLAHVMIDRARSGMQLQLHKDKLASLGTMAAGLAHELNNPASAARRAAQNLIETLQHFDELASAMLREMMFKQLPADGDPFQPLYDVILAERPHLDPITASEREDTLADWLEDQGVEAPWEVAATLVSVGLTEELLADFTEGLVEEHVINFLNWLPRDVEMRLLAEELAESTIRISDLVTAMKAYSYMDQAHDKAPIDLHKGIENTLTILNSKRKRKQVEIARDFGAVPPVSAYGGELNQVWTNLLDNAIAAVPEAGGQIEIKTCFDEPTQSVQVDVIDNGGGIPPEIQGRIFEPFFTTKKNGEGTGLGLDIAYRIVTDRHGGMIVVSSIPGETRFHVRLPVEG